MCIRDSHYHHHRYHRCDLLHRCHLLHRRHLYILQIFIETQVRNAHLSYVTSKRWQD